MRHSQPGILFVDTVLRSIAKPCHFNSAPGGTIDAAPAALTRHNFPVDKDQVLFRMYNVVIKLTIRG
jgi:hypothetical protein